MTLNKKYRIALIIALVLLGLVLPLCFRYHQTRMQAVMAQGDLGSVTLTDREGGFLLPFDADNQVFYCPLSLADAGKTISIPFEVNIAGEKATPVSDSTAVDFLAPVPVEVAWGKTTMTIPVQFTGLPFVSVDTKKAQAELLPGIEEEAVVTVIDPESQTAYIQNRAMFRLRGSKALDYDKQSFRLTLIDSLGEDRRISLLGMKESEKWALDAINGDPSYIRNKLGADLWTKINRNDDLEGIYNNAEAEFCEVMIDGEFKGLYALKEVLTRRNLPVTKRVGLIVEGVNNDPANYLSPDDISEAVWGGFEMSYPADDFESEWQTFIDTMASFLEDTRSADSLLSTYFYPHNYIDAYLFVNLIDGADNEKKGLTIAMKNRTDDRRMLVTPSDFDLAFGLRPTEDGLNSVKAYEDYTQLRDLYGTSAKLFGTDSPYRQEMIQRALSLLDGDFSEASINRLIDSYYTTLLTSGAITREKELRGYFDFTAETNEVRAYIGKRLAFLREYW